MREQDKVVGPRRPRHVPLFRHGRHRDRIWRRQPAGSAATVSGPTSLRKRLYVTGGLGPSADNEGFTGDYDLPNETAYAETCAAVGLVFWSSRMLGMGPDGRYGDIMELALYNGSISGLSLDGSLFFYENPLESRGRHNRWKWHHCPCCPPNIGRMVASIGSHIYGVGDDAIAVHLYGDNTARLDVGRTRRPADPDKPLSVGRRRHHRGRCRSAHAVHAASAHSGLVPQRRALGQWRGRSIWQA